MGEHLGESRMLVAGGLYDQPLEYFTYQTAVYLWQVIKTVTPADYDPDKHPELRNSQALIKEINAAIAACKAELKARQNA